MMNCIKQQERNKVNGNPKYSADDTLQSREIISTKYTIISISISKLELLHFNGRESKQYD